MTAAPFITPEQKVNATCDSKNFRTFFASQPDDGIRLFYKPTQLLKKKFLNRTLQRFSNRLVSSLYSLRVLPKAKLPELNKLCQFEIVTVDTQGQIIHRRSLHRIPLLKELVNDVEIEIVAIPGGTFMMGSPKQEQGRWDRESPQHSVTIKPFYMGRYPITQKQWSAVMGNNPSHFKGVNRPVENVSWHDAVAFCQQLSELTGNDYRLPTEAQWEYACRAHTTTPFYFGPTMTPKLANYNGNQCYASEPKGLYREQTTKVGRFPPNIFGLHDMHGNVWEWCADLWHENYEDAPTENSVWEQGGVEPFRLLRGGSWKSNPDSCRSAARIRSLSEYRNNTDGFRCILHCADR